MTPTKIEMSASKQASAVSATDTADVGRHLSDTNLPHPNQNVNGRLSTDPNADTVITNSDGNVVAAQHKGGTAFSLGTYKSEGRDVLIDYTDIKADRSPRRRAEFDAAIGFLDHV